MRRNKAVLGALAGLLSLNLLLSGCGKEATSPKPPLVKTQEAGSASAQMDNVYSGTVRGRYETNMAFQVGGQIIARNVQAGSRVSAGDTLMVLDPRDVQQQANSGDAAVASARAQLSLAQANLARYSELYREEAVSASVLDQYQTNYDAAFAAYQSALAQSAEGHNALGYSNLTAGANGVITNITAEEGQVVTAGQTVLTLVQTDELEIEINIPENHINEVTVDQPVEVTFWALPGTFSGQVREIAPMADSASRTYRVRISLPQPPEGMQLGMTASVTLNETANALPDTAATPDNAQATTGCILPLAAIYQTGDAPQVWVVTDDSTVQLKSVEVEDFGDDKVLVHGLAPTDLVVIAGVHRLREGETVRTQE